MNKHVINYVSLSSKTKSAFFKIRIVKRIRESFYKIIEPSYPNLPRLLLYSNTLRQIDQPTNNLSAAADYYQHNPTEVKQIFKSTKFEKISNHQDTETAINLFSEHFQKLLNFVIF